MDLQSLIKQRDDLKADMQATLTKAEAEGRDLTGEETEYFAEADKELVTLGIRIDTLQQVQGDPPADPATIADRFAEASAGQYVSALLRRKPTEAEVGAELDRIKGVRDICAAASLDPDPYIRAGLNPEQVSLVATEIKAAVESHIDTHQPPPAPTGPAFSTAKIYAARRQISVNR